MKPGSFISKEDSKLLQGIAVCLMVFHHLFAFPERIFVPFSFVLNFSFLNIETMIAYFGRICVAVFAFTSGYGMRKGVRDVSQYRILSGYKNMASRLWNFAQRFWAVFLVFIGLGLITHAYPWQPMQLLKGFFGQSYAYNAEWWYIGEYLRFLLLFPLLMWGLKLLNRLSDPIRSVVFTVLVLALCAALWYLNHPYIICFLLGIYFASVPVFEYLEKGLFRHTILSIVVSLGALGVAFLSRTYLLGPNYDVIHVSIFVFGFVGLLKCNFIRKIFGFVLHLPGKYSTYIWLTHTFFGYYLFQKITFFPRYSLLIFLWCMVLSIVSGWILESALTLIHKGFKTIKERSQK